MDGSNWRQLFAPLTELDDTAGREIVAALHPIAIPQGTVLMRQGDRCGNYLLVVEGSVKVFARAENGREMVLYRIASGGSCILTTSCLLSSSHFPAEAVAESEVVALLLPAVLFQRGLTESEPFRRFVFDAYGQRVTDLILLVEEVAFRRVDVRLARYLLAQPTAELQATHQTIAAELGTAREVVSRQLKEFEQRGWIALGRGHLAVNDRKALSEIAAGV